MKFNSSFCVVLTLPDASLTGIDPSARQGFSCEPPQSQFI